MKKFIYLALGLLLVGGISFALTKPELLKGSFPGSFTPTFSPSGGFTGHLSPGDLSLPEDIELGPIGVDLDALPNANYAVGEIYSYSSYFEEYDVYSDTGDLSDVPMYMTAGSYYTIMVDETPFSGIAFEIAEDGAETVDDLQFLYQTSAVDWEEFSDVSYTGTTIENGEDGTFHVTWEIPDDWSISGVGSYIIRIYIAENDEVSAATLTLDKIGVLIYNLGVSVQNELGDSLAISENNFSFGSVSMNNKVEAFEKISTGNYQFAMELADGTDLELTVTRDGYVSETVEISDMEPTLQNYEATLDYAHIITAVDEEGNSMEIEDAYSGFGQINVSATSLFMASVFDSGDITEGTGTSCKISDGIAYCPIGPDEDNDTVKIVVDGEIYIGTLGDRDSDSDPQMENEFLVSESTLATAEDPEDPSEDPEDPTEDPDEPTEDPEDPSDDPEVDCEMDYSDIDFDHWAGLVVCEFTNREVEGRQIIEGYDDGTFGTNEDITRAEFLKILVLLTGVDLKEDAPIRYLDVPEEEWYTVYVQTADYFGWLRNQGGYFNPGLPITRCEATVLTIRAAYQTLWGFESPFEDVPNNMFCAYAVTIAAGTEVEMPDGTTDTVVEGYIEEGKDIFMPNAYITRAEAVMLLYRASLAWFE